MTPTRAEVGMFHAQAAALRSAALGRQVGAALMTEEGDLLAVGMNDVPKFGGGHYWTGDAQDGRDFRRGYDQNDELKNVVLREIVAKLKDANLLATVPTSEDGDKLLAQVRGALTGTRVLNLTEFGRDVHAEMSVLTSAGRHGIRTNGCFLYTTTFPCHNCAKHIVAAGISRLIYIEPYAKSLARQFHPDSIDVEAHTVQPNRVRFEPFVGISPRRYTDWFRAGTRKTSDGKVVIWRPTEEPPVFARRSFGGVELAYVEREKAISREMLRRMTTAKLLEAEGAK